ncbi:hypothetical protein [Hymenobacter glacieicola]|uniref:Uncharacterized protein n=1 Tax=Hymenobacter glacieicola TaxID=1562124 RepID=A0ABQ1X509_9BACT|nr:hypothetical protein [Hymenobacter glacieicola]GGG60355.1 hypothetical protein GCM10011378_40410 [Hymenobacter glacieicola]
MAISKPPVRKAPGAVLPAPTPDEKKIEAVINRGSSALPAEATDIKLKNFNIKLPAATLAIIDELRAKRPRKPTSPKLGISTQDWLLEAIQEKIQREQKKYGKGI